MESGFKQKILTFIGKNNNNDNKKRPKTDSKKLQIITIIAAIALLFVLVIYAVICAYFKDHFLFGTTVNGINVSLKSVSQVEKMISDELLGYSIKIVERDGYVEEIYGKDIGIANTFDDTLSECVSKQNSFGWIVSLFKKQKIELDKLITYDKMKYEDAVAALLCLTDESRIVEPTNASISEYTNGGYQIIKESNGSTVNKDILKAELDKAITSLSDEINIEETGCYEEPTVKSDDEALNTLCDTLNKYVSANIKYTFDNNIEEVNGDMISTWLVVNDDYSVTLNETEVANYIQSLASKYNTIFTNRNFKTSYDGKVVNVKGGDYGWWLDQITEAANLKQHILNGEQITKEPEYKQKAYSHGENDYGNTYVEINITAQHLYFYVDGKLIIESDFVSGTLNNGHGTPSGTYSITYKERNATLTGENYSTPVSYWMPFNMDIGLHDAGWRSKFGGFIYKNNGSHGCINLPVDVAKTIFEHIEKGDPVFVYELAGTESKEALAEESAKPVVNLIKTIGEVTLESETAIVNARKQYDALSELAKKYVSNIETLKNAEEQLKALKESNEQSVPAQ